MSSVNRDGYLKGYNIRVFHKEGELKKVIDPSNKCNIRKTGKSMSLNYFD